MLVWNNITNVIPTKIFYNLVQEALFHLLETEDYENYIPSDVCDMFGRNLLEQTLENLLEANQSNILYQKNNYHNILLYYAIEGHVEVYNDLAPTLYKDDPECCYLDVNGKIVYEIDIDQINDVYFKDVDFLIDKKTVNRICSDKKLKEQRVRFNKDIFAIANRMMPHSDELKLKEVGMFDPTSLRENTYETVQLDENEPPKSLLIL